MTSPYSAATEPRRLPMLYEALANCRLVISLARRAAPVAVAGVVVLLVGSGLAPAVGAWALRGLIDHLMEQPINQATALAWAVAVGASTLLTTLIPYVRAPLDGRIKRRLDLIGQHGIFGALRRIQGLRPFETPGFLDTLRLARSAAQISVFSALNAALALLQALIGTISFGVAVWSVDPVLVAVIAATTLPGIFAQFGLTGKRVAVARRNNPLQRRMHFHFGMLSSAQAAKEIRLFGLGDYFHGLVRRDLEAVHADESRLAWRVLSTQGSLAALTALTSVGSLGWAVHLAATGRITVGDVTLYIAALAGLQNGTAAMVGRSSDALEALTLTGHLRWLLLMEPDLPLAENPRPIPVLSSAIEFHSVSFRYTEGSPWVLRDIDLRIEAGRCTALVGLNGAGKSTLVKLLCRFYDPVDGSITWDGVDIREFDPQVLRDRIGAVFQDFMRYELTAAQNIGLGDVARIDDTAAIETAAKLSGASSYLETLPHGLGTTLGRSFAAGPVASGQAASAADPSGGQWQRIALARSLMRADRDLLVLDEAGSGMDAEAEQEVNALLAEVRSGRTSVLISHRLGTIRGADVIHVVDGGKVAESGTHDELMRLAGIYRRLFQLQARGYEQGPGDAKTGSSAHGARTETVK